MTDREKLIEILKLNLFLVPSWKCTYEEMADSLLADNVVVREKGENLKADTPSLFECSKCGWCCWDTYTSDTGKFNFCPKCGADMRKRGDDGEVH